MTTAISDPFQLKNETALITGGGTGLGLAVAECMAHAGAKVVLVGRREAQLKEAAENIGPLAHYIVHDVTQLNSAGELLKRAGKLCGQSISILVNNAGIHLKKCVEETTAEDFQSVLTTHVCAAHALNRAAIPSMRESGKGVILMTASMTSLIGVPLVVAYSAAKSAYLGMVRGMASELSEDGIRVNAIAPGWIESPMLKQALDADPQRKQKILGRTPARCFGVPEDIGWAAVYLASPAARFITGVCLPVDGGASIGF